MCMDWYLFSLEPARNGTRGVNDPAAVNLAQVILHGTRLQSQLGAVNPCKQRVNRRLLRC